MNTTVLQWEHFPLCQSMILTTSFFAHDSMLQEFFRFYIKFSNNTGCPKIRGTT
jgi:hypothetical protein